MATLCDAFRETVVLAQAKIANDVPIVIQIQERNAGLSVGLIKQAMSNPKVIHTAVVESATHSVVDNVPSQLCTRLAPIFGPWTRLRANWRLARTSGSRGVISSACR